MKFEGKRVVITGASSGLGAEFARQLHPLGCTLLLVARRTEMLNAIASELNAKRPDSVFVLAADLSSDHGITAVEERIRAEQVDILINNAGRGSFGLFENLSQQEELQMIRLNIDSYLRLAHAVIPQMKQRRSGAIMNVSSVAAFQPLPYMATYAATKAFDYMHAIALRHELRPFGIRVTALCPGPTATEFGGVARVPGEWTDMRRDTSDKVVRSGIRALRRDRPFVVPGIRAWIMSVASQFLPVDIGTFFARKALESSLPRTVDRPK